MKVYVTAELYFKKISHKKNSLRETNAQGSTYTMRTKRTWRKSRRFHSPFVRDKKKKLHAKDETLLWYLTNTQYEKVLVSGFPLTDGWQREMF